MYLNSKTITAEIEYLLDVERKIQKALSKTASLEGYRLSVIQRDGKKYYVIKAPEKAGGTDSRTRLQYIGAPSRRVCQICERRILKRLLKRVKTNLRYLTQLEEHYQTVNPNELRELLPLAYQAIPQSVFDLTETIDLNLIAQSVYSERSVNYYPEHLRYTTPDGHRVRSKNELIAIYILKKLGIHFEYEHMLIVNDRQYSIDFWLTSPDGSRHLGLEIFGMMDHPDYRSDKAGRVSEFIKAGWTPGKDILFVYCDSDGSFDSQELERQLIRWRDGADQVRIA